MIDETAPCEVVKKIDRGRLGPRYVARVCDAYARTTGQQCGAPAMRGSTKCRLHGGKSLVGISRNQRSDGRYSRVLPKALLRHYEEARADAELLSAREEIALLSSRLGELAGKLHFGDSESLWSDLRTAYDELWQSAQSGDADKMSSCLTRMGEVIRHGNDNEGLWKQIQETCETLNRTRSAENKRLVDMRQMITATQAMALMTAILHIVQRNVTDAVALSRIQRELYVLIDTEEAAEVVGNNESSVN